MDTNDKTQQTNSFSGGMNTDLSSAVLEDGKYRLARNLRIVTNTDTNTSELHLIDGAHRILILYEEPGSYTIENVYATATLRDTGIIISYGKSGWLVWSFENPYATSESSTFLPKITMHRVYGPCSESIGNNYTNKLSIVTRWEGERSGKVYIADGQHPLMTINLNRKYNDMTSLDEILAYPKEFLTPIKFAGFTVGMLKSPVVSYAYLAYNKYGNATQISSPTKQISIPRRSPDGLNTDGLNGEEVSSIGVRLHIDVPEKYDRIKIFRISYVENGLAPTIEVISDGAMLTGVFEDVGQDALETYTVEEFNGLSGIHIIPGIIESKENYLFAANVRTMEATIEGFKDWDARTFSFCRESSHRNETYIDGQWYDGDQTQSLESYLETHENADCYNPATDLNVQYYSDNDDCQYKCVFDKSGYYGGQGANISWRFVITQLDGDECPAEDNYMYGNCGTVYNEIQLNNVTTETKPLLVYIKNGGQYETVDDTNGLFNSNYIRALNYSDPVVSSEIKSLRRDELYRYGIVLYDKYGVAQPVKWIQDIRVPSASTLGFATFASHGNGADNKAIDLVVRPIGIEFKVNNIPNDCSGYEIVRCLRRTNDIATISQGVVSRPSKRIFANGATDARAKTENPYTPTGFLTTGRFYSGGTPRARYSYGDRAKADILRESDNEDNVDTFQFISPEITYTKDSIGDTFAGNNLNILSVVYLFGSAGGADYNPNHDYTRMAFSAVQTDDNDAAILGLLNAINLSYLSCELNNAGSDITSASVSYLPITVLHPSIANTNLIMPFAALLFQYLKTRDGSDYEYTDEYAKDKFDVSAGKYENGKGIQYNDWLRVELVAQTMSSAFYSTRAKLKYETNPTIGDDHKNASIYRIRSHDYDTYISGAANKYNRYSYAKLSHSKIVPEDAAIYDTNNDGNNPIMVCRKSTSYIKLYELANTVVSQLHDKKKPASNYIAVAAKNEDYIIRSTIGFTRNTADSVNILRIKIAPVLQWDDFATSNNNKWTMTYIDKGRIDVGTSAFVNFVTGGNYGWSLGDWGDGLNNANIAQKVDDEERGNHANLSSFLVVGPSGGCAVFTIDPEEWESLDSSNDANINGTVSTIINHALAVEDKNGKSAQLAASDSKKYMLTSLFTDTLAVNQRLAVKPNDDTNYAVQYFELKTPDFEIGNKDNANYTLYDFARIYGATSDQDVPIYRNSILGTYLCNLRKSVQPYGGHTASARTASMYYGFGDLQKTSGPNSTSVIFDGDCYIQPFEYTSTHTTYTSWDSDDVLMRHNIVYSIPVETNINLMYTYGYLPCKHYDEEYVANIQTEASDVNNLFRQDAPEYEFNSGYIQLPIVKPYASYDPDDTASDAEDSKYDYRCFYSNPKENEERIDQWLIFMPANFLDVDTRKGLITGLHTFHNKLYFWLKDGTGVFAVNDKAQVTTEDNSVLMLGQSGVLSRFDYLSTLNGMQINDFSFADSSSTLYWWDRDRNELCATNDDGQVISLSKAYGILNWLNQLRDANVINKDPQLFYDNRYNELVANVTTNESVVYNEMAKSFTSMYDIVIKDKMLFANRTYVSPVNHNELYEWNIQCSAGKSGWINNWTIDEKTNEVIAEDIQSLLPYLKFEVNKYSTENKVFDNFQFGGRFYSIKKEDGSEGYNDTTLLTFTVSTPLKQHGVSKPGDITNREYDFRLAVPRNGENPAFGQRMRGKTMQVELSSSSNSTDFSLLYITTKFRISWS